MTDILEHGTVVSARRRVAQVNLDDFSFRQLGPSVRAIAALADEIDSLRAEVRELRTERQREHDMRVRLANELETLKARNSHHE